MVDPVVHFEIPADNPVRAKAFYERLFGWKIAYSKEFDYYMIKAKGKDAKGKEVGIDGGMMKRANPGQPLTNYVFVPSIAATLQKAKRLGASVCMPKTPIGTMGAIAAFLDTEGNMIGVHEMSAPAKRRAPKKRVKRR